MSLTRIGSIGINTGIAFAGVTTIVTLNTANDALSIGATVNVGSGITLGASGDGFFTGVVTATSYVGDGSALTGVAATDNVRTGILDVAGVGTFRNDVNIPDKIIHLGDTNTAIRFPAADTITAETGGSEALRIDSGGRLLLGTTTEGHAAADDLTIENTAADMGLTLRSGTSNQGAIYFSDGTSGDDEYRGIINYNHANDALSVYTNATEKIRIATDGRITVGTTVVGHGDADALTIATTGGYTGITLRSDTDQGGAIYFSDATSGTAQYDGFFYYNQNLRKMVFGTAQTNAMSIDSSGNIDAVIGNIVMATSGKGISFAATGGPNNGSGTSELLDDYEEGTFTPAYAMSSGGHNITYATQQGNYTKIGDTVSIEIYITINGINANGSGSLYVTGLPFTKTGRYGGMNISYPHGLNNNEITHALVDVNSTNLYLYNFDGSSVTNATVAGSFTVNTQMMFNGTYLAA